MVRSCPSLIQTLIEVTWESLLSPGLFQLWLFDQCDAKWLILDNKLSYLSYSQPLPPTSSSKGQLSINNYKQRQKYITIEGYYNLSFILKRKRGKQLWEKILKMLLSFSPFSLPIMFYKYVLQKKRILSKLGKSTRNPQRLLSLVDLDDSQHSEEIYLNHGAFFCFLKVKKYRKVIGPDYSFWHSLNKLVDIVSSLLETHIWAFLRPSFSCKPGILSTPF